MKNKLKFSIYLIGIIAIIGGLVWVAVSNPSAITCSISFLFTYLVTPFLILALNAVIVPQYVADGTSLKIQAILAAIEFLVGWLIIVIFHIPVIELARQLNVPTNLLGYLYAPLVTGVSLSLITAAAVILLALIVSVVVDLIKWLWKKTGNTSE